MLLSINKQLEKMMPFITPISVVIGVLLSSYLKEFAFLIPWIFALMTFSGSLGSNFRSLKTAIVRPIPMMMALGILHIVMPLWAWMIGHMVFPNDAFTITGLILGMAIPTGITSLIWVSVYKGNLELTLSIILLDTLLSPILVPYVITTLVGQKIEMQVFDMMLGLLGMIVIPSVLGMALNQLTRGRIHKEWSPRLAPISKIGLGIVVMLNGAVVAPYLKKINVELVFIAIIVLLIAITGYFFSFLFGKWLKQDMATVISLTFTGGMRNISAGAVIATTYFAPQVAVPVVMAMLFQQVLASFSGYLLKRHYSYKDINKSISA